MHTNLSWSLKRIEEHFILSWSRPQTAAHTKTQREQFVIILAGGRGGGILHHKPFTESNHCRCVTWQHEYFSCKSECSLRSLMAILWKPLFTWLFIYLLICLTSEFISLNSELNSEFFLSLNLFHHSDFFLFHFLKFEVNYELRILSTL